MVGAKLVARRLKALRFDQDTIKQVARLVELHLRFHGYGDGRVDGFRGASLRHRRRSAARPAAQAHPMPTAPPATGARPNGWPRRTENCSGGSSGCRPQEELAAVRPDLDGNEIMKLLGIPPGRDVGRAWQYLKELRMERGPLSRDEAEAELLRWWNSPPPPTPHPPPPTPHQA